MLERRFSNICRYMSLTVSRIRATLYNLLTIAQTYAAFSNTGSNDGRTSSYNSIENVHNAIHILVGGNYGHMQYIALSSFDPVFFLHHV